jgi:hypothetical protein
MWKKPFDEIDAVNLTPIRINIILVNTVNLVNILPRNQVQPADYRLSKTHV